MYVFFISPLSTRAATHCLMFCIVSLVLLFCSAKSLGLNQSLSFFRTKSNHHYLYHHRECYKSHTFMYSRIYRRRATSTTVAILAHQGPYRACVHRPSGRRRTSCSLWCIGHGILWGRMGAMRRLQPMGQVPPLVVGLHS